MKSRVLLNVLLVSVSKGTENQSGTIASSLMCRYSVPSVPPHLGSSKARAPLPLPLG